jgi:hypothetical protein
MIRRNLAALFTLVAVVLLAVPPIGAQDEAKVEETYTAFAVNLNTGPGPNTGRLTVRVSGWTADAERGALLQVLAGQGSEALVRALRKQPAVGSLYFTGTLAYDLYYARAFQRGETRHLVVATDRPISLVTPRVGTRSLDDGLTIVHLVLGPDGKGEGELLVGAELSLDAATGELTVEHLGTQPVRLTQVAPQK